MNVPRFSRAWRGLRDAVLRPERADPDHGEIARRARQQAPVLWLLGKVQSGKTSIVRAITGDSSAEIGEGFRSCTRGARVHDYPAEAPVLRFLDTRGLGDADDAPRDENLARLTGRAHMIVAVARAMDAQQDEVLDALRAVRRKHPDWPVILVQTCLHEGYPDDRDHPPYAALDTARGLEDLARCRQRQADVFRALPGKGAVVVVPVDLTPPEEGYSPALYGLPALLDALESQAPERLATILQALRRPTDDPRARRARPHIMGYAGAAAASDVVPVLGLVSVPVVQGKLLHSLGRIYGVGWDSRSLREFTAALGTGTLAGLGLSHGARQLGKLIPGYGQTAGSAAAAVASFAATYALGIAACTYLSRTRDGREATEGVEAAYRQALKEALDLARRRAEGGGAS